MNIDRPWCLGTSGLVRAMQMANSLDGRPTSTPSARSRPTRRRRRTALVWRPARSEPAPGSDSNCVHTSSPRTCAGCSAASAPRCRSRGGLAWRCGWSCHGLADRRQVVAGDLGASKTAAVSGASPSPPYSGARVSPSNPASGEGGTELAAGAGVGRDERPAPLGVLVQPRPNLDGRRRGPSSSRCSIVRGFRSSRRGSNFFMAFTSASCRASAPGANRSPAGRQGRLYGGRPGRRSGAGRPRIRRAELGGPHIRRRRVPLQHPPSHGDLVDLARAVHDRHRRATSGSTRRGLRGGVLGAGPPGR